MRVKNNTKLKKNFSSRMNLDTLWRTGIALKQKEKEFLHKHGVKFNVINNTWLVCKESSSGKIVVLVEIVPSDDFLLINQFIMDNLTSNCIHDIKNNQELTRSVIQTIRRQYVCVSMHVF